MYFQFLIEDKSAGILVNHVMEKLKNQHENIDIEWNIKTFTGIGHLGRTGSVIERKTGKLLNDLPMYLKAFDKTLCYMKNAAIIVVLDNDKRETEQFRKKLEDLASFHMILSDSVFIIAVKELEEVIRK